MNTMTPISNALDSLHVGPPVDAGFLTMWPLLGDDAAPAAYSTLDEALERGGVRISEVSEQGRVPELLLLNHEPRPVLVLDGEELVGAKQNRIANLTILVPAESRLNLPVSCVEAGRWHHRGLHAKTSKRAFYASGRALKARAVSESYRRMQRPVSDQREIWDDIALKSSRLRAHSETAEMGAIYERASLDLAGVRMRLDARPGQRGAIFTAGPALLGLDLFDSPETWRKLLHKLSASYGLDAIDRASLGAPPADIPDGFDAGAVLAHVKLLHAEGYPAVGLGQDVRLSGPQLAGGALVVDGLLVHLGVFGAPVAA